MPEYNLQNFSNCARISAFCSEVFIVASGAEAEIYAFEVLTELRRKNISAAMDFAKRTMKAQMKQAAKSGAKFALIIGEDEVNSKTVTVKNLETSEQEIISLQDLPKKIC